MSNIHPLADATVALLPFSPLPEQREFLEMLEDFLNSSDPRGVFVLNGYAGTGKTSLIGAFIRVLVSIRRPPVLLAPTGRAAKVANRLARFPASTIHKRIYRGDGTDPSNTQFFLAPNNQRDTLFIVDEASMISDSSSAARSLLSHLIHHVYSAPGCKILFIGDEAQLPPVGQTRSAALDTGRLSELGLNPTKFQLDIPVRQQAESGIILNATAIRRMIPLATAQPQLPMLKTKGFTDIEIISSQDLAERLSDSWAQVGQDETLIITRSNKRANNYNQALRYQVMYAEEPLQRGDRIIISKNDYYWSRENKLSTFIANGDTAEITWIGTTEKMYGRYFCDVELRMTDDDAVVGGKLMLRSLMCDGPSIPRPEMERFYNVVLNNYEGALSAQIKGVMEDPYYNAFQAKYAYCVTCHKAQGGEWKHVYIDMGGIPEEAMDQDFYRWLYTALTRATSKVFLINPTIQSEE